MGWRTFIPVLPNLGVNILITIKIAYLYKMTRVKYKIRII